MGGQQLPFRVKHVVVLALLILVIVSTAVSTAGAVNLS